MTSTNTFSGIQYELRADHHTMKRLLLLSLALCILGDPLAAAPRPNVVLVMMDDLGYGDLVKPLRGEEPVPDRTLIAQDGLPEPFRMTCVMRGRWRLLIDIKGAAQGQPGLYSLADDPLQRTNLIAAQPDRAKELRKVYDAWWHVTEPLTRRRACLSLGHPNVCGFGDLGSVGVTSSEVASTDSVLPPHALVYAPAPPDIPLKGFVP